MNLEKTALDYLAASKSRLVELASAIWERPELGLQETFAAGLIAGRLDQEGFSVEMGVGEMETAFVASWGHGRPIIGILGAYDALPSLSQRVLPAHDPIEEGAAVSWITPTSRKASRPFLEHKDASILP